MLFLRTNSEIQFLRPSTKMHSLRVVRSLASGETTITRKNSSYQFDKLRNIITSSSVPTSSNRVGPWEVASAAAASSVETPSPRFTDYALASSPSVGFVVNSGQPSRIITGQSLTAVEELEPPLKDNDVVRAESSTQTETAEESVQISLRKLSTSDLLCLCCCGICRPKTTASTLAFWPPKPSTYWFDYEGDPETDDSIARIRFSSPAFCGGLPQELFELQVSGFQVNTSGGNRIACAYVRCCIKPKFTVLFSHVNASDLGLEIPMILSLRFLAELCQCDYLCYDYSGYGISSGKPSEKHVYQDGEVAFQALLSRFNLTPDKIVLYGQSIGSVPTVDLAVRHPDVAGGILHSSIASTLRTVFPSLKRSLRIDSFPNIEKVSKISSPVLIIHGTADQIADCSQAIALYKNCPSAVEPLWIQGAGHNNMYSYPAYYYRLIKFFAKDIDPVR